MPAPQPKRILVVEDELLVAEDIAECLRFRGFDVCGTAKSSDEALALAREQLPDLALMDIVIQGERDGIETAEILRSELGIPVVFLTAFSQEHILERAKSVAPLGYIVKPFEESSLISTVEVALHKSGLDEELRRSKEWFSTTLNSIGDGVIATDPGGRVQFLNCLAEKMTGWRLDQARGRKIEEVFPFINETSRAKVSNPALEALRSGENRELANHTLLVCRSGEEIPIDDSAAPIRNDENEIVGAVLVFRDVTEKKIRERELLTYQEHLEGLVKARTSALAHRVKLERMAMEISADLIRLNEETYEDGLHRALLRIGQILGLSGCGIYQILQSGDRLISRPICHWAADAELQSYGAQDQPTGEDLPFWAEQMERDCQIVVRRFEDIPASAAAERELMAQLGLQALICLPVGQFTTVSFTCREPQRWSDDDLVLFRMFANMLGNVLERRELEAEQTRLREQLNQAQKLEAIGKLTGGIAHDFNNMLVPIIGYADSILGGSNKVENHTEVSEIRKAAESAAALTRQLLAFSRKQILIKKPLCVNELITKMKNFLQRTLGEDVQFNLELNPEVRPVEADPSQLEQVLLNLCVNARDAMPSGGKLWIRTRPDTAANGESSTLIDVADTGCGMEKEVLDRIFDPFFSTKGNDGTGLGLSVVLGVMEQHEGFVHAWSEPGKGSIFTISLPASAEPIERKPETAIASAEHSGNGQRILLIEDEPAVLQFVSLTLNQRGYEILPAETKAAALRIFEREHGRFDLIFTDAKLPDGNGIEVLEYVHSKNPGIPALISSGYTDNRALIDQARNRGVEFLQKPYSLNLLCQTVHNVLNGVADEPLALSR